MADIMNDLRTKAAEIIGVPVEKLDPSEELYDQGLDSVRLVGILNWLREKGHEVDFADLAEDTSLEAWQELLEDE